MNSVTCDCYPKLGGFEVGDIIGYQSLTGANIKARIIEFANPGGMVARGWHMLVESTHSQPAYPKGHRWWVRSDSVWVHLHKRKES